MKVAIQGELGSFSHEAAERMLPGYKAASAQTEGLFCELPCIKHVAFKGKQTRSAGIPPPH